MIQSVFFSLLLCVSVFAQDAVDGSQEEVLPPPVEVGDFTTDHFESEMRGLVSCMEEVPRIGRVDGAEETIGALMATRIEFQHCVFKAEAVIADARSWLGAIECAEDRSRVGTTPDATEASSEISPMLALVLSQAKPVNPGPVVSETTDEEVSLGRLHSDAIIIINALMHIHAEIVLVRDTVDVRVLKIRTHKTIKSVPDVLDTLP